MSIPNAPFGLLGNAPMQTQLVDGQRSVTPPWGGWLNLLRQWLFLNIPTVTQITVNSAQTFSSSDPIANGAFGDGIHDDTAIVQQTINDSNGVLYLRPNTTFLCSSTLTVPNSAGVALIYGSGRITSSSNPILSISSQGNNVIISGVSFVASASVPVISLASLASPRQILITGCFFGGTPNPAISLNSNATAPPQIVACVFGPATVVGIALNTQTEVSIAACEFFGGTPVTTAGTCTYTLRGCGNSTLDVYPTTQTSATANAGGGAAVPATVKTFIQVNVVLAGVLTTVKIPAFSP